MTQFQVDVYINGNYYDTFWKVATDQDDAEEQVGNEIQIEFETEEV